LDLNEAENDDGDAGFDLNEPEDDEHGIGTTSSSLVHVLHHIFLFCMYYSMFFFSCA
jgi:hypothetical protein